MGRQSGVSMRTIDIVLFAAYTVVSTTAIMLVKQFAALALESWKSAPGISAPGLFVLLGAALYAVSFLLWMVVLARNELSIVYPVIISLTLCSTTLAAWLVLNEPLTTLRLVGIGVIFVGVVLVTRS
jgi:drug/metabolite transporter (DMT)-like permease